MSATNKLIKDKLANQRKQAEEDITYQTIIEQYLKEHPEDYSIYRYFKARKAFEDRIRFGGRWEKTKDGFESRTNFQYNYDANEITFDTNRIIIKGTEVHTNGTVIANRHVSEHKQDLESLIKVHTLINGLIARYKEEIDKRVSLYKKRDNHSKNLTEAIYHETRHTKDFITRYGDMGIVQLIKWLNRLNDQNATLEELAEEFHRDINNAMIYFETGNHKGYQDGKTAGLKYEHTLLRVIERYSPRGKYLRDLYCNTYGDKLRTTIGKQ